MISKEEAAQLHQSINDMVDQLDRVVDELGRQGWHRAHIGSAMAGVGIALVSAHDGNDMAFRMMDAARNALLAGANTKN